MIKFVWLFRYPDGVNVEEGEKWYLNVHTQEVKQAHGIKGYYTWRILDVPERPTQFVRLTELWWDSIDSWRSAQPELAKLMSPAPWGGVGLASLVCEPVCVDVKPDVDIMKHTSPTPADEILRFVWVFRYPDGISVEEGEKWYLDVHVQENKHVPNLKEYYTWKVKEIPERPVQYVRLTELWWDSLDIWRQAQAERAKLLTPAPWGEPPLVCEPVFIHGKPDYDLMKDIPHA